jgi:signal transduction histidine kinase
LTKRPAFRRLFGAATGGSLVGRLVALAAGWCVLLLIAAGLVLTYSFHAAAIDRFDHSLSDDMDDLYAGASVGPDGEVFAPPLTDVRATRVYSGKYWEIAELRADGKVHALTGGRSRSLWDAEDIGVPAGQIAAMKRKSDARVFYDGPGPHGQALRVAAMQRLLPGRAQPVVFLSAEDRGPIDEDSRRFSLTTAIALILLGAGLVAAVVIQVRIGLSPLFGMRRDLSEVRLGRLEKLTGAYPSELAPLADELNALLDHNREVVERQRTHVGNLAHALKTPLSAMLMEAQSQPGPLAEVVQRQSALMRDHVEHHLRRARAAARSQTLGERTPVQPVIEELSRLLEKVYRTRDLDIDPGPEDLAFAGERQDLMEMAGNLLENACKWSKTAVRAEARAEGGRLVLVIEDDGPGLPADKRGEVLRRGARLDESAPGSGLGLSIVDDLSRAYGGSLKLDDSEMGGLRAMLTLPAAAG